MASAAVEDGGWYQGDDGEWYQDDDGEFDPEEEWLEEEDEYYDEDDEYDEYGGALVDIPVKRVLQHGINRQKNVGIHTIEIYYPQFYIKQTEMEEYDARPDRFGPSVIGKYTKGIGMIEGRFPTDDEDPISFALTVTHRLLDRMTEQGFNETGRYRMDDKTEPLDAWNSIGRLDIGSESLIDRSKSMKSYVMDLFERYGDGEANIEGVDMYNACYGGQAAGLCCVNWVESDRWDGRYGLSIATDISDAGEGGLFSIGAACTGALFFPDAPLTHTSQRASCILHRFDFFKPVGWNSMHPIVDGKYSIDAYMTAVETCYHILRKKMNDKPLLEIADYNVFHTGGGYHVVKKAFQRFINADNPKTSQEERQRLVENKLNPSCHILKIIGPCHTVSSFLNMSSVCMSQWDKALGKILMVYTYGSGCASSLYQTRFNDIPWFEPLEVWKTRFYRNAIHQKPDTQINLLYNFTWMKFDYQPVGRNYFGIPVSSLELDVYYLMEIDSWGRRFYHRGGMRAAPLPPEHKMRIDEVEGRATREKYGPPQIVPKEKEAQKELSQDERWKQIEFDLTYEPDQDGVGGDQIVDEHLDRLNPNHKIVTKVAREKSTTGLSIEKDGQSHSYQIVGTWTRMEELQDLQGNQDGSFSFEVVLGANGWEQFHLVQDRDRSRLIYPAYSKSGPSSPCIGPHKGPPNMWMLDGRDVEGVAAELLGRPGDRYLITFSWTSVKKLEWRKLGAGELMDDSKYFISGSWTCWDYVELAPADEPGLYTAEVQMGPAGCDFFLLRNRDKKQLIYPDVDDDDKGDSGDRVLGCDEDGEGKMWSISGAAGDVFRITFLRLPESLDEMRLDWVFLENRPVVWSHRYFVTFPGKSDERGPELIRTSEGDFVAEVELQQLPLDFRIMRNRNDKEIVFPDKDSCTQMMAHSVLGPSAPEKTSLCWSIGKAVSDKARKGDVFVVNLDSDASRISWKKKE
mmetsp:Transcript_54617/g.130323  ORF Transcript_54617/g.130323 Transcript_54617/m.130323 type:complete len:967 (+) Transcript_54617:41-2941(+)